MLGYFPVLILLGEQNPPNILLITLDDMNWDSPGVYGATVPDITPNMDRLANEGIRFEKAYVQAPNCSPSRSVIQSGLYPHQSGMRGFFYVDPTSKTLPEILKSNGYFTGVINKPSDSSLSPDFDRYWDISIGIKGAEKRSAQSYSKLLQSFLKQSRKEDKPFYCVVNIADPHKPFFNDPISINKGFDAFTPSRLYSLNDVEVPLFLPDHTEIWQEVLNYYNSVKRGDDCVGTIIKALKESKMDENTVVVLLSDHGMPFPFAKSSIYPNGIRTPFIVSWPDRIKKSSVNKTNLVSAIDFAPTIIDLIGLSIPNEFEGKSFYPSLLEEETEPNRYVFAQYDENAGGVPRPSRTVISNKYGYIFNPWATGKYPFKSAADSHTTYKTMKKLSNSDHKVGTRFNHWVYRTIEELYDYENDPNALNNLIDNPQYSEVLNELRKQLIIKMEETNDYVLPAFQKRENKEYLNEWMQDQIEKAERRTKTIKWKRYKNISGITKNNDKLFIVEQD